MSRTFRHVPYWVKAYRDKKMHLVVLPAKRDSIPKKVLDEYEQACVEAAKDPSHTHSDKLFRGHDHTHSDDEWTREEFLKQFNERPWWWVEESLSPKRALATNKHRTKANRTWRADLEDISEEEDND
jgi:hypothetical protein